MNSELPPIGSSLHSPLPARQKLDLHQQMDLVAAAERCASAIQKTSALIDEYDWDNKDDEAVIRKAEKKIIGVLDAINKCHE